MNRKETDVFDDIEGLILKEARKQYSETVIDHFMHPRNLEAMDQADHFTVMSGICGDTIGIFVKLENGTAEAASDSPVESNDDSSDTAPWQNLKIERCSFVTDGCGPTIACGSALTSLVTGLTVQEAMKVTSKTLMDYLGGLPLENTHCADLAVNTLKGALAKAENR